jgi:hypothetical protein
MGCPEIIDTLLGGCWGSTDGVDKAMWLIYKNSCAWTKSCDVSCFVDVAIFVDEMRPETSLLLPPSPLPQGMVYNMPQSDQQCVLYIKSN